MWVFLSNEEKALSKKRHFLRSLAAFAVAWFAFSIITSAFYGWGENKLTLIVREGEFFSRFLLRLAVGVGVLVFTVIVYSLCSKAGVCRSRVMVCMHCGRSNLRTPLKICSCGSSLVNREDVRWVDTPKSPDGELNA
jgi:hypothetical protein